MSTLTDCPKTAKSDVAVDAREALFNGGAIGPIEQIQDSTERIVSIRGILLRFRSRHAQGRRDH